MQEDLKCKALEELERAKMESIRYQADMKYRVDVKDFFTKLNAK